MTAFSSPSLLGQGRSRIGSGIAACVLLLLAIASPAARAQFNGPALGAGADINRPVALTTDPAVLYPPAHDLRLTPGDLLTIHVYGALEFAPSVRVSLDGSIQLPLIGVVPVLGLTLDAAEDRIARQLVAAGMYVNPQVTIQITESPNQVATVIGETHAVVPLTGQKRLFDVLSAAGGLPSTASHTITINRPGVDQPIVVDLGTDPEKSPHADIPIFAQDTIVVARMGVVYVLGSFKTQGAIPIQQNSPLTLLEVTALAGGPGFEGKYKDLRIIRTVGVTRQVVRVDLRKIMRGKADDPILQADDIIFLPDDLMKDAIKGGGIGTALAIDSVLIYLHNN